VNYVEEDQMMHASEECITQSDAIWGLNRISEKAPLLTGDYNYLDLAGEGAQVFVIDTGILTTHQEFDKDRATWGENYVDNKNSDCNGHGTHVAGTVAGTKYGVAKKSTVIAVKVLSCSGSGTNSGVIKGIQYAADPKNRRNKYAIANMSLGGGYSKALNDAIAAGVRGGITFVVAAGNDDDNACYYSPASEPTAITVGATVVEDEERVQIDERTSFSNFGDCVKILAPGQSIKAAWWTSNTATNTISGTSMASPHVAGVAALYLAGNPNASPTVVEKYLIDNANVGLIDLVCRTGDCERTPNLLLHTQC
jgi:serine protease